MVIGIVFLLGYFGDITPININIGDMVPSISLMPMDQSYQANLGDMLSSGFFVFLSPTCERCKEGIENAEKMFDDENVIYLFTGGVEEIKAFLGTQYEYMNNVFVVDRKDLEAYNIVTFPAVLVFKNGKCQTAMHGPLNQVNIERLKQIYHRQPSKKSR